MIDSPPVQHPHGELINKTASVLTAPWLRWFSKLFDVLTNVQRYGIIEYYAPVATGFSYQIGSSTGVLLLEPAGVYANGAVQLPVSPRDQQQVAFSTTRAVTALALTAGATIKNAPTALTAGQAVGYIYRAASSAWYRTQ